MALANNPKTANDLNYDQKSQATCAQNQGSQLAAQEQ